MLRSITPAAMLLAYCNAVGLETNASAESATELSLKWGSDGDPRAADGSKYDVEFHRPSFFMTTKADVDAYTGLEQVLASTIERIQQLEIVFDVLEKFPAHCTCCLGDKPKGVWDYGKTSVFGNTTYPPNSEKKWDPEVGGKLESIEVCTRVGRDDTNTTGIQGIRLYSEYAVDGTKEILAKALRIDLSTSDCRAETLADGEVITDVSAEYSQFLGYVVALTFKTNQRDLTWGTVGTADRTEWQFTS